MTFHDALLAWTKEYQHRVDLYAEKHLKKIEHVSGKLKIKYENLRRFVRITASDKHTTICLAFVARDDFETRYIGAVKTGDVFQAASCKAPKRKSCGNIFGPVNGLAHLKLSGSTYLS